MVRLQALIDNLSKQIDTVLRNSRQICPAASIQHPGQSNVPQQQQQISGISSIRYNSPNYVTELEATPPFIQLQTPSTYHPGNTSGLIQAASVVGQHQNMWLPSASSTQIPATSDPRMHGSYSSATINPPSIFSNWPLVQSQHVQHQPTDQQHD
ncbi:unnamed protein product [Rotaria sp. Silwood2]|nr:unnamed protein product [Rotaria sp. Silwood2]CAF3073582.1 unnamed protein product [Rotaria sp. Silwood2]CAF3359211.1 unnamed protein product [Rotaria sp. Silwood2]CAF3403028.1 unnamed protein product [Rotaria sp. Silwood2]CAF4334759.1 unnamed protein product [Rotaria sp. Silwood2]